MRSPHQLNLSPAVRQHILKGSSAALLCRRAPSTGQLQTHPTANLVGPPCCTPTPTLRLALHQPQVAQLGPDLPLTEAARQAGSDEGQAVGPAPMLLPEGSQVPLLQWDRCVGSGKLQDASSGWDDSVVTLQRASQMSAAKLRPCSFWRPLCIRGMMHASLKLSHHGKPPQTGSQVSVGCATLDIPQVAPLLHQSRRVEAPDSSLASSRLPVALAYD